MGYPYTSASTTFCVHFSIYIVLSYMHNTYSHAATFIVLILNKLSGIAIEITSGKIAQRPHSINSCIDTKCTCFAFSSSPLLFKYFLFPMHEAPANIFLLCLSRKKLKGIIENGIE